MKRLKLKLSLYLIKNPPVKRRVFLLSVVIPAEAAILQLPDEIPAFAGMTTKAPQKDTKLHSESFFLPPYFATLHK